MNLLITNEGECLDKACPLSEHPNPQFRRDSYWCLNGTWSFATETFKSDDSWPENGQDILVPFAPETVLSGVHGKDYHGCYLYYQKVFDLPEGIAEKNVRLYFEAVDQVCDVYLNGVYLGHHEGGYAPFYFDRLTLKKKGNVLRVIALDTCSGNYPIGKQSLKPGGIWYHPTSGIWGSVYLENVPKNCIDDITYKTSILDKNCEVFGRFQGKKEGWKIEISFAGKQIASSEFDENGKAVLSLEKDFRLWDIDNPNLYDVLITNGEDKVYSYFGVREISIVEHNGHKVPALNGKPIFLTGPLDQGYYPESGLTPPSDKAMEEDIALMKEYGFNMIRKHIKVEPRRWYYHCDRLGMLVMQDFVNIGAPYSLWMIISAPFLPYRMDDKKEKVQKKLGARNSLCKASYIDSMEKTVDLLKNYPSVIAWTVFNEGWGQFDTVAMVENLQKLDNSRLIDANSGWIDQGVGNFSSHHVYFRKVKLKPSSDRILSLSEFGGYSLKTDGHTMMDKAFGYKMFRDTEALNKAIKALYENEIIPLKKVGLSVAVYTQFSDVEEEINGLVTYDRKIKKVDPKLMRELNAKLKEM